MPLPQKFEEYERANATIEGLSKKVRPGAHSLPPPLLLLPLLLGSNSVVGVNSFALRPTHLPTARPPSAATPHHPHHPCR